MNVIYDYSLEGWTLLVMVSDGVGEAEALRCCAEGTDKTPGEIAVAILTAAQASGQDDATVVTISLEPSDS